MSEVKKNQSSEVSVSADASTVAYYSDNAAAIVQRYEKAVFDDIHYESIHEFVFDDLSEYKIKLIDVGCGSGRDLSYWYNLNVDCYGVDASVNIIDAAISAHPELTGRIFFDELPFLKNTPSNFYDVVICSAVLMHLNLASIRESVKTFKRILTSKGKLIISVPLQGPEIDAHDRSCKDGRLFTIIPTEYLNNMLVSFGFELRKEYSTPDSLGRDERSWLTLLYRRK